LVGVYGEPAMTELGFVVPGFLRERTGRITTIAVPGAGGTDPTAVNDRGQVVGFYTDVPLRPTPQYPPGTQHSFLWDSGRVTRLPDPPGSVQTQALDINNRGQIVGIYSDSRRRQHGFLFERGRYTTLDAPRPINTYAMGNVASNINDRGEIVIPEPITRVEPPLEQ
jgi:probable HAF family extracellular repeat protein